MIVKCPKCKKKKNLPNKPKPNIYRCANCQTIIFSNVWKKYIKPRKPLSSEEIKELKQQLRSAKNEHTKEKFITAAFFLAFLAATGGVFAGLDFLILVGGFFGMGSMAGFNSLPASKGKVTRHEKNLAEIQGIGEDDDRAPILLIRSFKDEEFPVRTYNYSSLVNNYITEKYKSTFAEAIEEHCQEFGPVITSINPEKDIQVQGGKHIYLENWHEEIEYIMPECQLIVAILGASKDYGKGFLWELEKIAELGLLENLIILLPDEPRKRWKKFFEEVNSNKTDYPNLRNLDLLTNSSRVSSPCITFSKDGKFKVHKSSCSSFSRTTGGVEKVFVRIIKEKLTDNSN